ncbi:MAG TPA: hypothetical protein VGO71_02385 [Baekduia sp.]|nr:hypothetical protein [Baekduia sp.]
MMSLGAIRLLIDTDLTPRQRDVRVTVTIQDIPIDVLAERLDTTRGALYKTLHDARRKLRKQLAAARATTWNPSRHDRSHSDRAIDRLLGRAEDEVSCDDCFAQLDAYVDRARRHENADLPAEAGRSGSSSGRRRGGAARFASRAG